MFHLYDVPGRKPSDFEGGIWTELAVAGAARALPGAG
jgi:hypothetical protein